MGFSAKQIKALKRNLDHRSIRTREISGRELSYIEGWYAISEANRIFGFDGWNRETIDSRCVLTRKPRLIRCRVYRAREDFRASGRHHNYPRRSRDRRRSWRIAGRNP